MNDNLTYDATNNRWYVKDPSKLTGQIMVNFGKYGQPYTPEDIRFDPSLNLPGDQQKPEIVIQHVDGLNLLRFAINVDDFGLAQQIEAGKSFDVEDGTHTVRELIEDDAISSSDVQQIHRTYPEWALVRGADIVLNMNKYGLLPGVSIPGNPTLDPNFVQTMDNTAMVFGSIKVGILKDQDIIAKNGKLKFENTKYGVYPDNFDFESNSLVAKIANPILKLNFNIDGELQKYVLDFVIKLFYDHCFLQFD